MKEHFSHPFERKKRAVEVGCHSLKVEGFCVKDTWSDAEFCNNLNVQDYYCVNPSDEIIRAEWIAIRMFLLQFTELIMKCKDSDFKIREIVNFEYTKNAEKLRLLDSNFNMLVKNVAKLKVAVNSLQNDIANLEHSNAQETDTHDILYNYISLLNNTLTSIGNDNKPMFN